jgi:preprotein translocase subunit SecB
MKPSPLELTAYFVTELILTANLEFLPDKPTRLRMEDLRISVDLRRQEGKPPWQIVLKVQQNVGPDRNSPYNFALTLIGLFDVHPTFPVDKTEDMVRINGSSMLYAAAREILRTDMARGPHLPLLLPSISFHPPKPENAIAAPNPPSMPPVAAP